MVDRQGKLIKYHWRVNNVHSSGQGTSPRGTNGGPSNTSSKRDSRPSQPHTSSPAFHSRQRAASWERPTQGSNGEYLGLSPRSTSLRFRFLPISCSTPNLETERKAAIQYREAFENQVPHTTSPNICIQQVAQKLAGEKEQQRAEAAPSSGWLRVHYHGRQGTWFSPHPRSSDGPRNDHGTVNESVCPNSPLQFDEQGRQCPLHKALKTQMTVLKPGVTPADQDQ